VPFTARNQDLFTDLRIGSYPGRKARSHPLSA
jgi:hypothetical protein